MNDWITCPLCRVSRRPHEIRPVDENESVGSAMRRSREHWRSGFFFGSMSVAWLALIGWALYHSVH